MATMNDISDLRASFSFDLGQLKIEHAATHSAVTEAREYFKKQAAGEIYIVEDEKLDQTGRYCLKLLVRLKKPAKIQSKQRWFQRIITRWNNAKRVGAVLDDPFCYFRECDAQESLALDRLHRSPSSASEDLRNFRPTPCPQLTLDPMVLVEIQRSIGQCVQQGPVHSSNTQGSDSADSGGTTILANMEANKDNPRLKNSSDRGLHLANKLTFSLVSRRPGAASVYESNAQIFQNELAKQVRLRAKECTIDASIRSSGDIIVLDVSIASVWKSPMHDYAIRRIVSNAVTCLPRFSLSDGIKLNAFSLEAVRRCYLSPPSQGSDRWLQYSLLCSESHDMPLSEFCDRLRNTVQKKEEILLECITKEDYKKSAIENQLLLYSIAEVLRKFATGLGTPNEELGVKSCSAACPRPDGSTPLPNVMDKGEKGFAAT